MAGLLSVLDRRSGNRRSDAHFNPGRIYETRQRRTGTCRMAGRPHYPARRHADFKSRRLGKTASCKYLAPEDPFDVTLLRQNLDSERCAIKRYQQICDMCWGKDFETFHISRKILHEELDHEQDWEDFLQDIKTGAQYAKTSNRLTKLNNYFLSRLFAGVRI